MFGFETETTLHSESRCNASLHGVTFRSHRYDNLKSLTVYGLSNDTVASAPVVERQMKRGDPKNGKIEKEGQTLYCYILSYYSGNRAQ
jgi:hypothetical protein